MIHGTFDYVVGFVSNVGFGCVEHVGFGTWIMNTIYSERNNESKVIKKAT